MSLHLPKGKKIAVSISADFDAHSLWMGSLKRTSPSYLSRGEFGAMVGVPRLLSLFERHGVTATWCTPTHTMETFPDEFHRVVEAGHEVAAHGVFHESVPTLDLVTEKRLMEMAVAKHEKIVGKRPRGYRSPAWDFTDHTLGILEEHGFEWDSSLMGRDFQPYHPRPVSVGWEDGSTFGEPSRILELPVSWFLDDFPALEHVPDGNPGLGDTDVVFRRWRDHFDYAYAHETSPMLALTVHPQSIGRAHHIVMFERFIEHLAGHEGVWFATLSEIYDSWRDD